ncbi:protocatechuate 3,4-dioxygenase [Photobacterium swingsii]|uniref:Protocatechuate 3,4-dioxygenase n=1 Tax=Photobacterium swingsii TaxID=680026 RepID=A0A2T3P4K5_9GAMM|nr:protocatechuate 3,4-dioxygenase [Photobacterium swingsii]PSW23454.1 protocatechuate 3,4-dioxygenase [Photobacterium swingsii]
MRRRHFLTLWSLLFAWRATAKSSATSSLTPPQAEGPFYPVEPIPSRSNMIINARGLIGKPMTLHGQVRNRQGQSLHGVKVEIWQCDGAGIYDHPQQANHASFDSNFAGFGSVKTDSKGQYAFQTLVPVPYNNRPPHIHVKLWQKDRELLTTQLYLKGQTGNEWWGGEEREQLQIDIVQGGEYSQASFDFVVNA